MLENQSDIEDEILKFYGSLMGTDKATSEGVDMKVLRRGNRLSMVQRAELVQYVTVNEIGVSLKSICDIKSPGVDFYGAKFFKHT